MITAEFCLHCFVRSAVAKGEEQCSCWEPAASSHLIYAPRVWDGDLWLSKDAVP